MSLYITTFAARNNNLLAINYLIVNSTMRRFSLLLLGSVFFASLVSAQDFRTYTTTGNDRFSIKVQPFLGSYLDKNTHFTKHGLDNLSGMNLGVEFPSAQQRPWQQYLNNPTVGLGLSFIDFEHDMIGKSIAMYPYIMLNAVRLKHFEMKVKLASGLGVVSEHWYTQEDQNPDHYYEPTTSTIFGCYLNAYLSAGLNLNFPITRNVAINSELGYFHMSNGRTCMPNMGANVLYGGLGLIATINPTEEKAPIHFPDLPYKWSLNVTGSLGAHKAAIADENRFLISSFHTGAVYSVNNWYGVGLGLDAFYNGAITKYTDRSLYCKCGEGDYTVADKIRVGVGLNNEFRFGQVTAIVDWGVYLYNPSRNYYEDSHEDYGHDHKHPLFYKSMGASSEETFHYIRFGLKYRIWDNLYLQTTAKTHLHICEYIEFGVGYQFPFLTKDKRKSGESVIFHNRKGWWK